MFFIYSPDKKKKPVVVQEQDSKAEQTFFHGNLIEEGPILEEGHGGVLLAGHAAGPASSPTGDYALNHAGAAGAAHLTAIQNAQAVQAGQIANSAAAAIHNARQTEAAGRAAHAHALQNAQALEAARIANLHRAQAAAVENARASEAARRAAAAGQLEVARAAEAERIANAARLEAIAIANSRAQEAARIAQAARAQAAAVAASAAHAQAAAEAAARHAQEGAFLLGNYQNNNAHNVAAGGYGQYAGFQYGGGYNPAYNRGAGGYRH